jgi:hypothetical protein
MNPQDDSGPDMITMNPRRRWPGRSAAIAGVAVVALAGGTGIGYAATHSSTAKGATDTAAVALAAPAGPSVNGQLGSGDRMGHGPGGVLHGQFTVPKSGGGYQTVDVQSGKVTAVSAGSITAKSADGFTATYAVTGQTIVAAQSAGIGSVKDGNTVFVIATGTGSTPTAASVFDITALKASHAAFGFGGHPMTPPGGSPMPS